ncbi:MAG TPA: PAS domain S-box protein [Methanosarcinales archaeon]|nr:PAS domain S-box protein [Methanosarcinales archaeon]
MNKIKILGVGLKERHKLFIIAVLLVICILLTYYFHTVLKTCTIFTHFFYIPIILSALWWKREGLTVGIFLVSFLIFSHFFVLSHPEISDILIRSSMLMSVALVTVVLSESIDKTHDRLRLLSSVMEQSREGMAVADLDGNIIFLNDSWVRMHGYESQGELIGEHLSIFHNEEQMEGSVLPTIQKVMENGFFASEVGHIRRDGTTFPASMNVSVLKGTDDRTVGIAGIADDITERKKTEEEVLNLQRYNRGLIEASLDPLVTFDSDGIILDVNEATVQATGISRNELVGTRFAGHFTDPEKAHRGVMQVFETGVARDYELVMRASDGRETIVAYNASVYRDQHGEVAGAFAAARDITDRKRIEEDLARALKERKGIMEAVPDIIYMLDLDGNVVRWNKMLEIVTGLSPDELMGRHALKFFPEEDRADVAGAIGKVLEEGAAEVEAHLLGKDGTPVSHHFTAALVKDEQDNPIGITGVGRDITELKKAEKEIRRAAAYNRSLIEASIDPLVTIGHDGRITDVNRATEKITGRKRGELIGSDFSDYFTEPAKAREGYGQVFEEGYVHDYPLEIRHRDGSITPVLYNASVYRDESGVVIGVFAAARDITELKKAENEIKESQERLKTILDHLQTGVAIIDAETHEIVDVNPQAVEMIGAPKEEIIGRVCHRFICPAEEGRCPITDLGQSIDRSECEMLNTDGDTASILKTVVPVMLNDRRYLVDSFIDITERKKAEESLKLYQFMVESAHDAIFYKDTESRYVIANPTALRSFGLPLEEVIGRNDTELLPPEEAENNIADDHKVLETGNLTEIHKQMTDVDGKRHHFHAIKVPHLGDNGNVIGIIGVARDITELKRVEEERKVLIRRLEDVNQKLAESNKELQDFAYVASHDLREPLRKIASFGRLLEESLEGKLDEDQQENFEFMIDGANRMQEMVNAILSYSRVATRAKPPEAVDLNRIIDDLKGLELSGRLEETAGTIVVPEPLPSVYADPTQVRQLFQNLIGNGLKYHQQGRPPEITIRASEMDGMVRAEVSDNGIGIAEDRHDDVFIMFRRLHPRKDYEGTGIGLSVCKRIVDRHGGNIWISSTPGEGSTFYFTLPKG